MDLQKPELSNKTQRRLSGGGQTCSPGSCPPALPAVELIPGWGRRFPRSGVWLRAAGSSALYTHLKRFPFPPFKSSDPSLPGWAWAPSSVLHSLPVTLPECPQVGRKASLTWRKLGAHWGSVAGLPNKGLSETQILWDPSPGLPRDAPPSPTPCPTAPGTCRKEEDIR